MQLGKRKSILDLLWAQVPIPKICETVDVSRATVFRIQKSGSFTRKLGSGGYNLKHNRNFKNKIRYHINNNPLKSIRKTSKKLKVHKRTVRRTLKQFGAHSYVSRKVQLLSEAPKQSRLACGKKIHSWMKKQKFKF